jgi:hypothetical protein
LVSPTTINFEVQVIRNLFNYLARKRGVDVNNPSAKTEEMITRIACYELDAVFLGFQSVIINLRHW